MSVPRITRDELKAALDAGTPPLLLDVRLKYAYDHSTRTLPGAIRMAPEAVRSDSLDRNRDIVVYDSDPDELVSARVAAELIGQDFRARALKGGLPEWLAANFPTDAKDAPRAPAPEAPSKG